MRLPENIRNLPYVGEIRDFMESQLARAVNELSGTRNQEIRPTSAFVDDQFRNGGIVSSLETDFSKSGGIAERLVENLKKRAQASRIFRICMMARKSLLNLASTTNPDGSAKSEIDCQEFVREFSELAEKSEAARNVMDMAESMAKMEAPAIAGESSICVALDGEDQDRPVALMKWTIIESPVLTQEDKKALADGQIVRETAVEDLLKDPSEPKSATVAVATEKIGFSDDPSEIMENVKLLAMKKPEVSLSEKWARELVSESLGEYRWFLAEKSKNSGAFGARGEYANTFLNEKGGEFDFSMSASHNMLRAMYRNRVSPPKEFMALAGASEKGLFAKIRERFGDLFLMTKAGIAPDAEKAGDKARMRHLDRQLSEMGEARDSADFHVRMGLDFTPDGKCEFTIKNGASSVYLNQDLDGEMKGVGDKINAQPERKVTLPAATPREFLESWKKVAQDYFGMDLSRHAPEALQKAGESAGLVRPVEKPKRDYSKPAWEAAARKLVRDSIEQYGAFVDERAPNTLNIGPRRSNVGIFTRGGNNMMILAASHNMFREARAESSFMLPDALRTLMQANEDALYGYLVKRHGDRFEKKNGIVEPRDKWDEDGWRLVREAGEAQNNSSLEIGLDFRFREDGNCEFTVKNSAFGMAAQDSGILSAIDRVNAEMSGQKMVKPARSLDEFIQSYREVARTCFGMTLNIHAPAAIEEAREANVPDWLAEAREIMSESFAKLGSRLNENIPRTGLDIDNGRGGIIIHGERGTQAIPMENGIIYRCGHQLDRAAASGAIDIPDHAWDLCGESQKNLAMRLPGGDADHPLDGLSGDEKRSVEMIIGGQNSPQIEVSVELVAENDGKCRMIVSERADVISAGASGLYAHATDLINSTPPREFEVPVSDIDDFRQAFAGVVKEVYKMDMAEVAPDIFEREEERMGMAMA